MFLLKGPDSFVQDCGSVVAEIISGKGMAKDNKMQGKAEKLQRKEQAVNKIREYISTHVS